MRLQNAARVLILGSALVVSGSVLAQTTAPSPRVVSPPATAAGAAAPLAPRPIPVVMETGSGRLLQLPGPASTILAADPRIARVQPASPTSIFVMGVAAGHTTVIATAENGTAIAEYDVTIRPGAPALGTSPLAAPGRSPATARGVEGAIRQSLPGMASVRVTAAGRSAFVVSGTVANAADSQRAEAVARAFAGEGNEIINNLELLSATQVNVRVRVAEISRQITRELGFNWQALGRIGSFVIGLRTGGGASNIVDAITGSGLSTGTLATTASRLGAGVFTKNLDINSVIDALAADQLITILAEPKLDRPVRRDGQLSRRRRVPRADRHRRQQHVHYRRFQAVRRKPFLRANRARSQSASTCASGRR